MVTSDFIPEVEIRPFHACAMHPAIITGTVRSLLTWLCGRYHFPQNAFLVLLNFFPKIPRHHWYRGYKNINNTDHTLLVAHHCNLHSRYLHHKASWYGCTDEKIQEDTRTVQLRNSLNKQKIQQTKRRLWRYLARNKHCANIQYAGYFDVAGEAAVEG